MRFANGLALALLTLGLAACGSGGDGGKKDAKSASKASADSAALARCVKLWNQPSNKTFNLTADSLKDTDRISVTLDEDQHCVVVFANTKDDSANRYIEATDGQAAEPYTYSGSGDAVPVSGLAASEQRWNAVERAAHRGDTLVLHPAG